MNGFSARILFSDKFISLLIKQFTPTSKTRGSTIVAGIHISLFTSDFFFKQF